MSTRPNLGLLHQGGDGWIVSTSARSGNKDVKDWILDETGWTTHRDDQGRVVAKTKSRIVKLVVPHTVNGVEGVPFRTQERQIARWSADAQARDARDRADALAKAAKLAANPSAYSASGRNGVRKHIQARHVDPETGEVRDAGPLVLDVDHARAEREARFDGYQMVRTSETELPDQDVLDRYRQLWRIEQTFRVSKTGGLNSRPVYVRTPQHIEAHFAVCFLALLVTRLLERWTGLPAEKLLHALRGMTGMPVGSGVYRVQRTADWAAIDGRTGAALDQSWATLEELRAWGRALTSATKTHRFPTQSDTEE